MVSDYGSSSSNWECSACHEIVCKCTPKSVVIGNCLPDQFKPRLDELSKRLEIITLKTSTNDQLIEELKSRKLVDPSALYNILKDYKIKKIEEQIKQLQIELSGLKNPDAGSPW